MTEGITYLEPVSPHILDIVTFKIYAKTGITTTDISKATNPIKEWTPFIMANINHRGKRCCMRANSNRAFIRMQSPLSFRTAE